MSLALGSPQPVGSSSVEPATTDTQTVGFASPAALLAALATKDEGINTLNGEVRFTTIQALEGDVQTRHGWLNLRTDHERDHRDYAVRFDQLIVDQRLEEIDERYAFDGQWFVERLPDEKQFNKRQLVPNGETLDPMELMRDAPFWVSLGRDTDRVLASYNAELLGTTDWLVGNEDFPELSGLGTLVEGCVQLKLTPKAGSGLEDDWDHVRIWVDEQSLLPRLYVKAEWTGNLQIVELFGVKTNEAIEDGVFSTATPTDQAGWNIQISPWRGKAAAEADG
ncbi:MAG: hypothetical protein KC996_01810 [Phycisphaerales bacterium]|nr:hypothetical protein [Phycisphaerales bacterium]